MGLAGGGQTDREESSRAWQRFIESIAADRPLVLLFEDLHWADDALLAFIERLVDWSSGLPILVLCTGRPELYETHAAWGGGKRNSTTVALSPLSQDETAHLIAALLETAVLPAETQAALLDRAGGNPLYAEEYARLFLELGSADDLPLPDSVQGLIAARLDTLPPDRKALLQDAAVIGKVFWAGALESIGERSHEDVREGLHQLARKELLRPARLSSVEGQTEYSFWHALIRDVAYGQIPRSARAAKHEAAAHWLEQMAGERVADHADLLAHHTTRRSRCSSSRGRPTRSSSSVRRGTSCSPEIVLGARRRQLPLRATAEALELLPTGSEEHGLTLLKLAETAQAQGRFEEARIMPKRPRASSRQSGRAERAGLRPARERVLPARRRRSHACTLEHSLELLEPLPPGPGLVDTTGGWRHSKPEREFAGGWARVGGEGVSLGEELGLAASWFARTGGAGSCAASSATSRDRVSSVAGRGDRAPHALVDPGVRQPCRPGLASARTRSGTRDPDGAIEFGSGVGHPDVAASRVLLDASRPRRGTSC